MRNWIFNYYYNIFIFLYNLHCTIIEKVDIGDDVINKKEDIEHDVINEKEKLEHSIIVENENIDYDATVSTKDIKYDTIVVNEDFTIDVINEKKGVKYANTQKQYIYDMMKKVLLLYFKKDTQFEIKNGTQYKYDVSDMDKIFPVIILFKDCDEDSKKPTVKFIEKYDKLNDTLKRAMYLATFEYAISSFLYNDVAPTEERLDVIIDIINKYELTLNSLYNQSNISHILSSLWKEIEDLILYMPVDKKYRQSDIDEAENSKLLDNNSKDDLGIKDYYI